MDPGARRLMWDAILRATEPTPTDPLTDKLLSPTSHSAHNTHSNANPMLPVSRAAADTSFNGRSNCKPTSTNGHTNGHSSNGFHNDNDDRDADEDVALLSMADLTSNGRTGGGWSNGYISNDQETAAALLLTTHYLEEAEALCERVGIMNKVCVYVCVCVCVFTISRTRASAHEGTWKKQANSVCVCVCVCVCVHRVVSCA